MFDFAPNPIAFSFGVFEVHWYGIIVTVSIIAGAFLFRYLVKRSAPYNLSSITYNLVELVVLGGLIGARLWTVFIEAPGYYFTHPFDIIKIWEGGLGIFGALIGGGIVLFIILQKQFSIFNFQFSKFLSVTDLLVPALALGQAIGRWGNFFNQELYGLPTNLPWGIFIEPMHRVAGFESFTHFHPTFLYESLGDFLIVILLVYLLRRPITYNLKPITSPGLITALYCIGYGVLRFSLEFIRIDPAWMWAGLGVHQWSSFALIIVGVVLLVRRLQAND